MAHVGIPLKFEAQSFKYYLTLCDMTGLHRSPRDGDLPSLILRYFNEYYLSHGVEVIWHYNMDNLVENWEDFFDVAPVEYEYKGRKESFKEWKIVINDWQGVGIVRGKEGTYSYDNQPVILQECLARNRMLARWTLFVDVDDLIVPNPHHFYTLRSFLLTYDNLDLSDLNYSLTGISDGPDDYKPRHIEFHVYGMHTIFCWKYDLLCKPTEGYRNMFETMRFRECETRCAGCTGWDAHAKYVIQTDYHKAANAHHPSKMTKFDKTYYAPMSYARVQHFREGYHSKVCTRNAGNMEEWTYSKEFETPRETFCLDEGWIYNHAMFWRRDEPFVRGRNATHTYVNYRLHLKFMEKNCPGEYIRGK